MTSRGFFAAEQLFDLVLAILLVAVFVFVVKGCISNFTAAQDPALESLDKLIATVDKAERWDVGTSKRVPLAAGEASIVVFNKNSEQIITQLEEWKSPFFMRRPQACPKESVCVCLCKEKLSSDWVVDKQMYYCKDQLQQTCRQLTKRGPLLVLLPKSETVDTIDGGKSSTYFEGGFAVGPGFFEATIVAKKPEGVALCAREC